jgi:DNA-binding FadR family transcriptional regulator
MRKGQATASADASRARFGRLGATASTSSDDPPAGRDGSIIAANPEKKPRSRERLHGAIARRLGVEILSGVYAPGQVLGNEVAFSEQLKVSRTAYREAVQILAAKGLVESRPKVGTKVTPRSRWRFLDPVVLSWFFEMPRPDPEFVRGIFELRQILEPAAAALAARRRDMADVARMRQALMEMQRLGLEVEGGREADRQFHDAIIDATKNEPFQSLASGVGAAVRWTTIFKTRHRKLPRDPMPEHWRVFDAIATGDPEAATDAMKELIRLAEEDTRHELDD